MGLPARHCVQILSNKAKGGEEGRFLAEFQDPPVAGEAAQEVEAVAKVIEVLRRKMLVVAFFVVDVSVVNPFGIRRYEIFKRIPPGLHRGTDPGMANVQSDPGL